MARRGELEPSSERAERRRKVKTEQRVVEMVTEVMRPLITTGESLESVREGLVFSEAYKGRTYSSV